MAAGGWLPLSVAVSCHSRADKAAEAVLCAPSSLTRPLTTSLLLSAACMAEENLTLVLGYRRRVVVPDHGEANGSHHQLRHRLLYFLEHARELGRSEAAGFLPSPPTPVVSGNRIPPPPSTSSRFPDYSIALVSIR